MVAPGEVMDGPYPPGRQRLRVALQGLPGGAARLALIRDRDYGLKTFLALGSWGPTMSDKDRAL